MGLNIIRIVEGEFPQLFIKSIDFNFNNYKMNEILRNLSFLIVLVLNCDMFLIPGLIKHYIKQKG